MDMLNFDDFRDMIDEQPVSRETFYELLRNCVTIQNILFSKGLITEQEWNRHLAMVTAKMDQDHAKMKDDIIEQAFEDLGDMDQEEYEEYLRFMGEEPEGPDKQQETL